MRRLIALLVIPGGLAGPVSRGSLSGTFEGDSTLTPTGTQGIFTQNFTGDGTDATYGVSPRHRRQPSTSPVRQISSSRTECSHWDLQRDPVWNQRWDRHR